LNVNVEIISIGNVKVFSGDCINAAAQRRKNDISVLFWSLVV